MARYFSVMLVASAVVALLLALSMASAQGFGGYAQNGGGGAGDDGGSGGGGGGDDSQQGGGGGGGSGGGGGGSQDRGPIQFPPAPMSVDTSSVVIGGSGFGFVPPRAGGYNFGSYSGYRGGSPFGGGYRGGGYRGSASTNFGGLGGYGFRGGAYSAPSHRFSPFGGFGLHYG